MSELSSTRGVAKPKPYDAAEVKSRYFNRLRRNMVIVRDMILEGEDRGINGKDMEMVKEYGTSEKGKSGKGRKAR